MTRKQRTWWYGLVAAFLGGVWTSVDSGLAVMLMAPTEFNLDAKLGKTLLAMLVLGLLAGAKIAMAYLKQSPLPPMDGGGDQPTNITSSNNMKLLLCITGLLFAAFLKTHAATPPDQLFAAHEFDLTLGGTASIGTAQREKEAVVIGTVIGGDYFLTRSLGLGARAELTDFTHSVIDRGSGRITLRAPVWDRVAPYGYLDGGYNFERDRVFAGAGGGLEFRFTKAGGVFGEAGLETDTRGNGTGRAAAGLRVRF